MSASDARLPCRWIEDTTADAAWQMAVDEALLESVARGGRSALRFYRWSEPSLSLGYFQAHAERAVHEASRDCALVRRQTGGGAILHDVDLTYSLAASVVHPWAADTAGLYRIVHQALIRALHRFGVAARLCEIPGETMATPPFLCFRRRAVGDVLVGEAKICGSAQRRRRGAILQHGSVLLAQSKHAPELPGIAQLAGRPPDPGLLGESWRGEIAASLRLALEPAGLSAAEVNEAQRLIREKYGNPQWNYRR